MSRAQTLLEEIDQMQLFPNPTIKHDEVYTLWDYFDMGLDKMQFMIQVSKALNIPKSVLSDLYNAFYKLPEMKRKEFGKSLYEWEMFIKHNGIDVIE